MTSKKMLLGTLNRIGNCWKQNSSATLSASPLLDKNTGSRPERKLEGLLILLAKRIGTLLVNTDRRRRCNNA